MNQVEYDERKVLRLYFDRYWDRYVTVAERECWWLGIRLAKAEASKDPTRIQEVRTELEEAEAAQEELREAVRYYNSQRAGLGKELPPG